MIESVLLGVLYVVLLISLVLAGREIYLGFQQPQTVLEERHLEQTTERLTRNAGTGTEQAEEEATVARDARRQSRASARTPEGAQPSRVGYDDSGVATIPGAESAISIGARDTSVPALPGGQDRPYLPSPRPTAGFGAILHGVRRRFRVITATGLAGSALAYSAAWFALPLEYEAAALVHVASHDGTGGTDALDDGLLNDVPDGASSADSFDGSGGTEEVRASLHREFGGRLSISRMDGNGLVRIVLRGSKPTNLPSTVNEIAKLYIADVKYAQQSRRKKISDHLKLRFQSVFLKIQLLEEDAAEEAAPPEPARPEEALRTRAAIQYLRQFQQVIGRRIAELELQTIECVLSPRIQISRASQEAICVNRAAHVALMGVALVLGLSLPAGLILFKDAKMQLVNSSEDVSRIAGLPVMGALPLVPRRLVQRLGAPTHEAERWKTQLTESVDGIAARLLHQPGSDRSRVVLVTSAVGGEGKTSLATQLAMSLAHRGRKTVLVDCSLRRPAISGVFNLPLGPGVSEFLRGEGGPAVQQTSTRNLSVLTAGRWDRTAVTALAGESAAGLFARLREEYDFVVMDSSPILPVADTRFLSQHADIGLLCAMRDVSRLPRVSQATEILEAFGVEDIEVVVVGGAGSRFDFMAESDQLSEEASA